LRSGVRLAIDWGDVRIGVAACDRDALLAYPLSTVRTGESEIPELVALAADQQAVEIVVGLPRSLSGGEGPAARKLRERAAHLAAATPVPVRLVDERLTTVTAAGRLRESGKRAKQQRESIDAAAAVVILEEALAYERARHEPPGELVSAGPG
jgi:putative holliday junction resolvase